MEQEQSTGPLIGIIIIVLILVLGGIYYAGRTTPEDTGASAEEILSEEDPTLESLTEQSTSDEVADIEEDLDLSEFDSLDEELGDIDDEFAELENI